MTAHAVVLLVEREEVSVLHAVITMGLCKHSVLQAKSPQTLPPWSV